MTPASQPARSEGGTSSRRLPALDELRAVVQPPDVLGRRNAEHWAGTLYLRRLSLHVTRLLIPTGISANGVTWLMIVIGLLSALVLTVPAFWAVVVAALGIQLQILLDCSDGEIARWRGTRSAVGVYLDRIAHYTTEAALPLAFGIHADGGLGEVGTGTLLGALTAIVVVLNKGIGDLVHVSRASAGLPPLADDGQAAAPRGGLLRRLRSALRFVPFFRAFVAIEFTLLVLAVALADLLLGTDGAVVDVAVRVMPVLAVVIAGGHLAGILASARLRP